MKQCAVDFLTNPVLGDGLLEAMQRALARSAAEREKRRTDKALKGLYYGKAFSTKKRKKLFSQLYVRPLPSNHI
jgi:FixJ family two-component response regulator